MNITDPKTLDLMAEVEFPVRPPMKRTPKTCSKCARHLTFSKCSYCGTEHEMVLESKEDTINRARDNRITWMREEQMFPRDDDAFTFIGALRYVAKINREALMTARTEPALAKDDFSHAIFVIYGTGGWNRWMVTQDGEVHFSKHHSTPEKIAIAEKLGFKMW